MSDKRIVENLTGFSILNQNRNAQSESSQQNEEKYQGRKHYSEIQLESQNFNFSVLSNIQKVETVPQSNTIENSMILQPTEDYLCNVFSESSLQEMNYFSQSIMALKKQIEINRLVYERLRILSQVISSTLGRDRVVREGVLNYVSSVLPSKI